MFPHYEKDLQKVFDEAIEIYNEMLTVVSRLKSIFGDCLPDLVIEKLSGNLLATALPLD